MTRQEIIDEFIRVTVTHDSTEIHVCVIGWDSPATPISTWVLFQKYEKVLSDKEIEQETNKVLKRKRYFKTCLECNELKPAGWMDSPTMCQSCGERVYGIVH